MQLTETLVAVAIFTIPLGATVQLTSQRQTANQGGQTIQQLTSNVDADRLAVQTAWLQLTPTTGCRTATELQSEANKITPPTGLQRQVQLLDEAGLDLPASKAVRVSWKNANTGELLRRRIYTPMALGLCS